MIFGKFRLQKSVLLTIEPCLMVGIVINNVFVWKKQRNIRKKSDENLQKPRFSAEKKFFSKIRLGHVLSIPNTHLCAKNQEKLMMKSRENAKKPVFPAYFRHFRPENMFFENWAPSHFRHCYFATVCKISWKNIKYSSRNSRNTVFPAKICCSGDF